jgi:hypothetical protein
VRLITILALASAVIWRRIGDPNFALTLTDVVLIGVMAIFLFIGWAVDRASGRKQSRGLTEHLEQNVSIDLARAIDKMSQFIEWFSKDIAKDILQEQFRDILRCMEHKIRIYLQREDSLYFNVSLLVFTGSDGQLLTIKERSRQIRSLVANRDATQFAAYYAAKMQKVKVFHDFPKNPIFPQRGLSEESLPYRSILLLPLDPVTIAADDPRKICRAVVSIDSQRPYEFWGTATNDIQVQMRPFLSIINMMLTEQAEGVPVDDQTRVAPPRVSRLGSRPRRDE